MENNKDKSPLHHDPKKGSYSALRSPPVALSPLPKSPLHDHLHDISNTEEKFKSRIDHNHDGNRNDKPTTSSSSVPPTSPLCNESVLNEDTSDTLASSIPASVSFDSDDTKGDISETNSSGFISDNSSSEWYKDNRSSISSRPSSFSNQSQDKLKARESVNYECGEACPRKAQKAFLERYSSCSFANFGAPPCVPATPPSPTKPSSASTSVLPTKPKLVGSIYTEASHSPASGKRHCCIEIRNPVVDFFTPSACLDTRGVAVTDILKFEGQCVINPGTSVGSKLTNGDLKKTSIDLVIEWKGHSREVISIPVRCGCGHDIKRGQIALEIARAHVKYFATQRCEDAYRKSGDIITGVEDLRLMSLHTTDNGITWRAQHAFVQSYTYEIMDYRTRNGNKRSGTAMCSGRGRTKKIMAWV